VENVRAREKTGLAIRLTPPSLVRRLDRLHGKAGRPPAWTVARLCAAKILLVLFVVPIGLLFVTASPSAITLVIALLAAALAYFLPELLLHSEGQKRSQAIALELADTLDQMSIAVEAGLGFESAMAQVARNGNGPLAQELVRTLQDMQVGQTRRQAYEALGQRSDVRDLRRFISAVIQADAYGIAIADVLRTQAGEMRLKRRQRAEEKAMKIPVKVIFPLLFCILPTLFIVLLGPAAIGIIGAFA
jgi:tight adherence protein C